MAKGRLAPKAAQPSRRAPSKAGAKAGRPDPRRRAFLLTVAAVFLVLCGTAEERTFGTVSDEQQMLATSLSMAAFGEIGVARGQRFMIPRPEGDAVMPYGMGQSLVEAPALWLAWPWESLFGARSTQTLFVLLEIFLVTAAAAAAGLLARALGASAIGEKVAILGAALASPLWAYTASGFSEPLQAACLTAAILCAAKAPSRDAGRGLKLAAAAGFFAGFAVLVKGVNLVLVPVLLAPLVLPGAAETRQKLRTGAAAAAGAATALAVWLAFEIVRFGKPLSSYGDQKFTHPPLDGLWRLVVGLNKGVLWYFPLLALAAIGLVRLGKAKETRGAAVAAGGAFLAVLGLSSAWWAWDGNSGWGPRFLVPALPALAAVAGSVVTATASRAMRRTAAGLVALGIAVNVLGALQADAATFYYVSSAGPVQVTVEEARRWPASFLETAGEHGLKLGRPLLAASDAAYSPLRLHAFLLWSRLTAPDSAALASRLKSPPWISAHPEAVPEIQPGLMIITNNTPLARYLLAPFTWPHLFSSVAHPDGEKPGTYNTAFLNAVSDQVFRNLESGRPERALPLARFVHDRQPSGFSAALVAESLRKSGSSDELATFLASLPDRVQASPTLEIVKALAARDAGQEGLAHDLLLEASRRLQTPGLDRALRQTPAEWPRNLRAFVSEIPDPPAKRLPVR